MLASPHFNSWCGNTGKHMAWPRKDFARRPRSPSLCIQHQGPPFMLAHGPTCRSCLTWRIQHRGAGCQNQRNRSKVCTCAVTPRLILHAESHVMCPAHARLLRCTSPAVCTLCWQLSSDTRTEAAVLCTTSTRKRALPASSTLQRSDVRAAMLLEAKRAQELRERAKAQGRRRRRRQSLLTLSSTSTCRPTSSVRLFCDKCVDDLQHVADQLVLRPWGKSSAQF